MTKRHLIKTSILAGLAAVCPVVAAPIANNIDVAQYTHFAMRRKSGGSVHGPLECFGSSDLSHWINEESRFYILNMEGNARELSILETKQLLNI